MWQYMLEYFTDRYTRIAKEKKKTAVLDAQTVFSAGFVQTALLLTLVHQVEVLQDVRIEHLRHAEKLRRSFCVLHEVDALDGCIDCLTHGLRTGFTPVRMTVDRAACSQDDVHTAFIHCMLDGQLCRAA